MLPPRLLRRLLIAILQSRQRSAGLRGPWRGRPLVFLHGGTVSFQANYAAFGWPQKFIALGFQVVGLDLPKHVAAYWNFVEATVGDRAALKAFAQAEYPPLSVADARGITHRILVVSGDKDRVLGRGPRLAGALGNAKYLEVSGADHFSLAADETVKDAVAAFIAGGKP